MPTARTVWVYRGTGEGVYVEERALPLPGLRVRRLPALRVAATRASGQSAPAAAIRTRTFNSAQSERRCHQGQSTRR